MVDRESIYQQLPVGIQNIVCSFEGWRIQRTRFGEEFRKLLSAAEERSTWSDDRIADFRDSRLRRFIEHSVRTVPFYQRLFKEHGLTAKDIKGIDDMKRLPVLSKISVQDRYQEFASSAVTDDQKILIHTSGTTGGGLRFHSTRTAVGEQWATWWRYRRWHRIPLDTWCAYFGGRTVVPIDQAKPPFWRYNNPGKQIFFSGYHMSPTKLQVYLDEIRSRRPVWFHGYPSLMALLAVHVIEKRTDLGYQVTWVTTGAENLLPQQKRVISQAFGVEPLEHYGMAEAVANISECEFKRLHVDEDFAAVEFVPNEDTTTYKVVGTNFTNLATPLIRYDVQDCVSMSNRPCECGRPGRIVKEIDGRQEDYVILGNGAKVGRMDHVFKDLMHIREGQIVQRRIGEVILRVVRVAQYTLADEQMLFAETRKRVGADTEVRIEYVDKLPRSSTGKLRFVVTELQEGRILQSGTPQEWKKGKLTTF